MDLLSGPALTLALFRWCVQLHSAPLRHVLGRLCGGAGDLLRQKPVPPMAPPYQMEMGGRALGRGFTGPSPHPLASRPSAPLLDGPALSIVLPALLEEFLLTKGMDQTQSGSKVPTRHLLQQQKNTGRAGSSCSTESKSCRKYQSAISTCLGQLPPGFYPACASTDRRFGGGGAALAMPRSTCQ